MIVTDHQLHGLGVIQAPSPNHGGKIDGPHAITIHYTAGRSYERSLASLRNGNAPKGKRRSAHLLIARRARASHDERNDHDESGEYRCPHGHIPGLNVISELWIRRESWDGSDLNYTIQHEGYRRGVLVPCRLLVISRRLYDRLQAEGMRGLNVEVVHLV